MADPQRDAPIGEILSAMFPASGTAVIPKVVKVALGQSAGNAGVLSWQNPEPVGLLAAVVLDITTVQSAQTADIGVDGDGTGTSDTLLDGVSLATAGAWSSFADAGTNGAALRKVDAKGGTSDYVTATASGTPSSLVGNAYIVYVPVS
ncbi:MAG: hypothetical protein O3B65_00145 [Chloroflexi bacterium]|nr:hypothetical protein [Chloroflexota bacterium]